MIDFISLVTVCQQAALCWSLDSVLCSIGGTFKLWPQFPLKEPALTRTLNSLPLLVNQWQMLRLGHPEMDVGRSCQPNHSWLCDAVPWSRISPKEQLKFPVIFPCLFCQPLLASSFSADPVPPPVLWVSEAQGLHVKLCEPQWQSTLLCQPLHSFNSVATRLSQVHFRRLFLQISSEPLRPISLNCCQIDRKEVLSFKGWFWCFSHIF